MASTSSSSLLGSDSSDPSWVKGHTKEKADASAVSSALKVAESLGGNRKRRKVVPSHFALLEDTSEDDDVHDDDRVHEDPNANAHGKDENEEEKAEMPPGDDDKDETVPHRRACVRASASGTGTGSGSQQHHPARDVLDVIVPEKVSRNKVFVRFDGFDETSGSKSKSKSKQDDDTNANMALDLSGDIGAVGRFMVHRRAHGQDASSSSACSGLTFDLKGEIYDVSRIAPTATVLVLAASAAPNLEAKVECVATDVIELQRRSASIG